MSYTSAEAPVFRDLPVRDNLELGGFTGADGQERARRISQIFAIFPILEERQSQLAGTLSGGQQRMLSLGMAIMARPKLMLLDEPSLGLSPAIVQSIFQQIRQLAVEDGASVLLVEPERAGRVAYCRPGVFHARRGHYSGRGERDGAGAGKLVGFVLRQRSARFNTWETLTPNPWRTLTPSPSAAGRGENFSDAAR